jgi:hypothetical protein
MWLVVAASVGCQPQANNGGSPPKLEPRGIRFKFRLLVVYATRKEYTSRLTTVFVWRLLGKWLT